MREPQIGEEMYYTGDRANNEAWGRIAAEHNDPRWGRSWDIEWRPEDEKPITRGLTANHFTPGPGRRFWFRDEWEAERLLKISAMTTRRADLGLGG